MFTPQERMNPCKPGQNSMAGYITGSKREPIIVVLHNDHIKLTSTYLHLNICVYIHRFVLHSTVGRKKKLLFVVDTG